MPLFSKKKFDEKITKKFDILGVIGRLVTFPTLIMNYLTRKFDILCSSLEVIRFANRNSNELHVIPLVYFIMCSMF